MKGAHGVRLAQSRVNQRTEAFEMLKAISKELQVASRDLKVTRKRTPEFNFFRLYFELLKPAFQSAVATFELAKARHMMRAHDRFDPEGKLQASVTDAELLVTGLRKRLSEAKTASLGLMKRPDRVPAVAIISGQEKEVVEDPITQRLRSKVVAWAKEYRNHEAAAEAARAQAVKAQHRRDTWCAGAAPTEAEVRIHSTSAGPSMLLPRSGGCPCRKARNGQE
jgi:hypothetical protein